MNRTILLAIATVLLTGCSATDVTNGDRTVVENEAMAHKLLGRKPLTLQWISWDEFGEAVVTKRGGVISISGEQRSKTNDDYLRIDGRITKVEAGRFFFDGSIEIQVSHILGGEPYRREGLQEFFLYGNRGFWRLRDMENADGSVDYVDIYFDLATARKSNAGW